MTNKANKKCDKKSDENVKIRIKNIITVKSVKKAGITS